VSVRNNSPVLRRAVVILLFLVLLPSHVRAEARIALLIGNQAYTPKVGVLRNPHEDVAVVGAALKQLGFQVTTLKDAGYRDLDIAIKRFIADVRSKGRGAISFFYYSGHGAANPDTQINYLIPVDVADPNDGNLWYQSFQQNDLIDKLSKQAPNATHYVVFDACRNELNLSGPAAKAIGAEKGFVPVPQTPGLLIAYATAQGKTATDVGDNGGPYAKPLAIELVKPHIEAVTMFRNVQIRVKEEIGQDPWLSFPALPSVYLAGRTAIPHPALSEASQAWALVKDTTDIRALEAFRRQYGTANAFFDRLAEAQIENRRKPALISWTPTDYWVHGTVRGYRSAPGCKNSGRVRESETINIKEFDGKYYWAEGSYSGTLIGNATSLNASKQTFKTKYWFEGDKLYGLRYWRSDALAEQVGKKTPTQITLKDNKMLMDYVYRFTYKGTKRVPRIIRGVAPNETRECARGSAKT